MTVNDPLQMEHNRFRQRDAHSVGAGVPANTGAAGARLRVGFFAGAPAPTEIAEDSLSAMGRKLPVGNDRGRSTCHETSGDSYSHKLLAAGARFNVRTSCKARVPSPFAFSRIPELRLY